MCAFLLHVTGKNLAWSECKVSGCEKGGACHAGNLSGQAQIFNKRTEKKAEAALNNEINDVMDNMEIFEDALDRTFLFGELHLREQALDYMKRRLKRNPDGSFDDELLKRVYNYYFGEK